MTTDPHQQLLAEIKAATREAHEVLADLRRERAEFIDWLDSVRTQWRAELRKNLETAVETQVDKLAKVTRKTMDSAVARVLANFDRLYGILTGKNEDQDLETLTRQVAHARSAMRNTENAATIPPALRRPKGTDQP